MIKRSVKKKLTGIVGGENAVDDPQLLEQFSVECVTPGIVLFPVNIEQISEVMKAASRAGASVIPMGSGTKRALGNRPSGADIVLSVKKLDRIIEHESADLVATAECGITLGDFNASLGAKNQFLPVDPPHIEDGATVGGIIAANDSGPLRLRYGTARELLIGMKVVRPDGSVFKGGSKVVKNVAGYDLPKLFVGSLGTLGIIAEATFRLYPVPESTRTYITAFESLDRAHDAVRTLIDSNLVINALEYLNPALAGSIAESYAPGRDNARYSLAVRIMNVSRAVEDQMKTVEDVSRENGGSGFMLEGGKEEAFWKDVREFPWAHADSAFAVLKAGLLISDVPRIFLALENVTQNYGIRARASSRAANGVVIISVTGDKEILPVAIKELREFAESSGGSLVVTGASPDIKPGIDAWGAIGSSLGLMKRIKAGFDPGNILNPGRLF